MRNYFANNELVNQELQFITHIYHLLYISSVIIIYFYSIKTMFPSVKQKQESKQKAKDKQWDDGAAKGSVPQYSPLKDKHTGSYRKLLMSNSTVAAKANQSQTPTNKKIKQKTYFQKKLELMAAIRQKHAADYQQVRTYEDLMNKNGAPNFYSYFSLMPLLNIDDPKGFLLTQTKKLKQKSAAYHRISTSVRARDQCLQRLKKNLQKLKQTQIIEKKGNLKEQINHLRLLTANVIQQIKLWRQQLGKTEQRVIYVTDDQKNYLIQILNDNKFVYNSKLGQIINFGEKNDPFLIAPLKKAQGKEKSQFMEIIETEKPLGFYQKFMEYLASQKAYQVNLNETPVKKSKSNSVQKIYTSAPKLDLKQLNIVKQKINEDQDAETIQRQKQRQQRLKKNQQKINSIKSIYENYASKKKGNMTERKPPQTDVDDKRQTFRVKKRKKSQVGQSDFDGLVKLKLDSEKMKAEARQAKQAKQKSKKKKDSKSVSMTKLPKPQEKMIDNLREIQQTLKSKLQIVQKQNKLDQSSGFSSTKYIRKNNEDLVKQLKMEIIQKIQKQNQQKQKLRKKKKQQQQKAMEEIKQKMKKQMQQKLEQKKRQKMVQREQLEKRLKQEQQRLNNQRQMEIQLQIKLNKQKQMRQLQKIRRQSLQKQKKFREQLEKQQKLRRQKQEAIERQKKEKQRLLQELKKKQLKQQIQQDLRKQLMQKKKIQDQAAMKQQIQAIKKQKQNQLTKQIQLLKLKQKEELNILEKQSQIRERMLKLKKQQEELKRKQVQALMKNVIQKEKESIDREAFEKRIQLQQSMRANIKQKMLEQYKNQREAQIEANKSKRQKQLQQQVYREKIRQKIQKQMRIQAINRTKKDLDERQSKKYQMRTKLENIKYNIENNNKIDKNKIEEQVKKDVIQRVIFDKNAQRQNAKMALRAQFQRQLLSSAVPQIYEPKDSFLLKHTQQYTNEQHLNKRMQITAQKPTNQRPGQLDQRNITKNQIKDVRTIVTNQQLQIYTKQKNKVNQMRDEDLNKPPTKLDQQEEEGFQLMNPDRRNRGSDNQYDVKIVRKQKPKPEEEKFEKKKKKKARQDDSEDSDYDRKRRQKAKNKKKLKKQQSESQQQIDSEDDEKIKAKKKKNLKKKANNDSEQQQDSAELKKSPKKKRVQFGTSQQEKEKEKRKTKLSKTKKPKKQQQSQQQQVKEQQKVVVYFDAQKGKAKDPNLSQIQPITIKKTNMKQVQATNKFEISLDAIPEAQLDEYLEGHFARLPQQQIHIQLNNRQDLYRKLIGQLTFCLMLGNFDNKLIGMAFAYHDRSRSDIRKFVIVHIGTYRTQDLKQFIINVSNYIFRKDPCDQIQFHYRFDESDEDQLNFSVDFNTWFDKYGNVYQKKLQNSQFERKYALKRQFNQKCEIVLGGVNKNIFRNIFSVYAGVMMSDADMVLFKQQLRDVISPEDQMSYAILIAELFRTYLTPDEAQALKGKVKQFVKLKQLLVLVVMLQKKKVKMQELKLYEFKSLIQLNMKLMSQGKDVIRYCKDSGVELNRVFFCQLSHGFNLPFNFQTTSLPVQSKQNQIRQISYFRLAALPPYKLHIIRSSIYNGQMNILPTQNSKYKMFIMNAQQYMQLKDSNKMDLFMYIRLFLKNVKSHNVAVWKYVWMPEMMDKGSWNIREFKSFLSKDIYAHDSVNISYRQFLPGALIIQPDHRDLVITPPFIVGIMSMTLEQVTEGSPLYARLIDIDALRTIQIEN